MKVLLDKGMKLAGRGRARHGSFFESLSVGDANGTACSLSPGPPESSIFSTRAYAL